MRKIEIVILLKSYRKEILLLNDLDLDMSCIPFSKYRNHKFRTFSGKMLGNLSITITLGPLIPENMQGSSLQ